MKIYIYIISLLCTIFTFTDVKAQPVHERYPSAHKNRLNSPNNEIIINQTNTYRDEINSTDRYGNTYGENTSDVYYKLTLTTKAELNIWPDKTNQNDFAMVYLLDYSGECIGITGWDSEAGIKKVLNPNTYYIVVERFYQDGPVSFNIESNVSKSTPINIGTKSSDFTYTNTQNSNLYHTFTNGYGGGPGNDIPYTFTITKPMDITISHCGSAINYTNIFFTSSTYGDTQYCGTYQAKSVKRDLPAGTYTFISEGQTENGNITTAVTGTVSKTIDKGNLNFPFSYQDTRNSNDFNNDYTDYAGKEVRYRISHWQACELYLQISNCGSSITDTRIQLLNGNGQVIESSIDYNNVNSPCNGSKHAFLRTKKLSFGTYFITSEGRSANGNITTKILASKYPFETDWSTLRGVKVKSGTYKVSDCLNLYEAGTGNDIIHKFTLEDPLDVSISHAGSTVNKSKIYLLNSSKGVIATSESGVGDPNGSNTSHAFLKRELLPAGTYYIVSEAANQDANLVVSLTTSPQEKPAIDIGAKSANFVFSDTKRFQDYTNTYKDNAAVDIEYKLTLTQVMDLALSCTSGSLYLLDSHKELIKGVTNLSIKVVQPGTYYIVNTSPASNEGNTTIKVTGTLTTASNYIYPSSDKTYVEKRIYTDRNTYLTEIQYYDGLGRPDQLVKSKFSPEGGDLVSVQEYDGYGRPSESWLPAPIYKNNSKYMENAQVAGQARNIYGDTKPYSSSEYEQSPLKKVLKQYGPGKDWHDNNKGVSADYKTNVSGNTTFNCYLYKVSGTNQNPTLTKPGNYATGKLYVTEVKDEGGNTSYEFKDKLGRTILSRQVSENVNHDTYHIYNDRGYLCYVLPPRINDEGITQSKLDELAYQYKYDDHGRCIAKKLPGCDWIYYIYDRAHQVIFTQDGEQRLKGVWTFTIPDAMGRIVLTGTCSNNLNYLAATPIDGVVKATWAKVTSSNKGYTLSGITLSNPLILSANYYDSYEFMGLNGIPATTDASFKYAAETGYGTWHAGDYTNGNKYKSKGLLTGTLTAQLNSNGTVSTAYLYSVMYYDYKGQLIQIKSNNHLTGGIEKEYIAYNFTGQPVKKMHVHTASGKATQTEYYTYEYDHAGRLLKTKHKLNTGAEVLLAENTYDELGRLITNKKNNLDALKTTYTYNVRGWTNKIANPHFNQTLTYAYNGNISRMQWGQAGKNRTYTFAYDNLSRLKSATYSGDGNFNTSYTYDKHGNIKTLQRYGLTTSTTYGLIDNLTAEYTGNQLKYVSDAVNNFALGASLDFKEYTKGTNSEYTYNKNGAMAHDLNKGISQIQYNYLNLPQIVDIKNQSVEGRNEYTYSASGQKLKVVQKWNPNYSNSPVIGSAVNTSLLTQATTTDYVGNIIYENGLLKRILVEGGYYEGGNYYFYIRDHLGNNRIVANAAASVVQSTQYYPFGMPFADAMGQNLQPYKYNDKELDTRNGLNMYDYSARYMDFAFPHFPTADPLAEMYYSISPYVYCANNPIKFIDPTGMWYDDYYNYDGDYLGTDNRTTDNIRIISNQDFYEATTGGSNLMDTNSSNLKAHQKLASKSESIETAELLPKAYSKMFTNILSKMEDVDMKELYKGKVAVAVFKEGEIGGKGYNEPSGNLGQNASSGGMKGKIHITATIHKGNDSNLNLYSTVSNVQNLLGAHEFIGHGVKDWGDRTKTHYKVYEFQMDHSSWSGTTSEYKQSIQKNYQKYITPYKK